jgi:hypothetical protein
MRSASLTAGWRYCSQWSRLHGYCVAAAWLNRGQPFGYLMEWPWWLPNQALGLDLPAADILRTTDWQVRARLRDRIIIRRELPRSELG